MKDWIDLRSDTVTLPTPAMRRAMAEAEVGDDVYEDDPTVNALQRRAAALMGKEAALFVASGTMGNQVAVMTHTHRGDEMIASSHCHIVHYEYGSPARLSGVCYALVDRPDGLVTAGDIRRLARPEGDPHFPRTGLVCLENALCSGEVAPLEVLRDAYDEARARGIPVHLDGARIFNAALALGVQARQIAACADSVMFCISKGLCAPVGSLLCGSKDFIRRARANRKALGGGMRQAGVLAACGLVALDEMLPRLGEDHENARYLAGQLNTIPGLYAELARVRINMVFWKTDLPRFNSDAFVAFMAARGIKVYGILTDEYRFVTHHGVGRAEIDQVIAALREYAASVA